MAEWFRRNAGIVVFNKNHQVLVCERIDILGVWQFPQGGIEDGENPEKAALRELYEETSMRSVKVIKTLDVPARYHFPPAVRESMLARGYDNAGQDVYWSLLYFYGSDTEINLSTSFPEFRAFKWIELKQAYELCADFKKPAYEAAVKAFAAIMAEYPQIYCA